MNEKVLHTLEYDRIKEMLVSLAGSAGGKADCEALLPVADKDMIEELQEETAAAYARIMRNGSPGFSGLPEVGEALGRVAVKATPSIAELRKIGSLLRVASSVRKYGMQSEVRDVLSERFELINPLENIEREINRCILSDTEMADDASRALRQIRQDIKRKKAQISEKITSIMREYADDDKLSDSIITMRNNRYVVPVKAEYKSKVPGMIHDRSASRGTFFIEPMEIVNINNEIRELEAAEQDEIERILMMLGAALYPELNEVRYDIKTLRELDAIFARGQLAKKMRAARPVFSPENVIDFKKARHPLIDDERVVPTDLKLGGEFEMLIITGPNTGGKTVSLKTMGLFHLMAQSGLHVPVQQGSTFGVFDEVYADIGDEQSIEQSLSTFSSHMTNIINIVNNADEHSLVLFDELGAGTDPVEGAALAMAILNDLKIRGVYVMATTHYSELKAYALTEDRVVNGSCEFDVATLKPTYKVRIGVPGKSNAFAIAGRLGMDESILKGARAYIGEKERSFDDMLTRLEELHEEAEKAFAEADEARADATRLRRELEDEKRRLKENRSKQQEEAREEAAAILAEAKEYADEVIRRINKESKNADMRTLEEARRGIRKKLDDTKAESKKAPVRKSSNKVGEYKIGSAVKILSQGLDGTVLSLPDKKGMCRVKAGIFEMKCNISDLEIVKEVGALPEKLERNGAGVIRMSKGLTVSPEINLVGKYPDEAIAELEKYLDDAYIANLEQVRIIHGRGTGALRKAVWDYLKRCRNIKGFREGEYGEGDHGVTIAVFKQ